MKNYKEIRLLLMSSLVFSFGLSRCGQHDSKTAEVTADTVSIYWENNKPVGVWVPYSLFGYMDYEAVIDSLQVYVLNSAIQSPILGDYDISRERIIFRPIVPFTAGLQYEVRLKGEPIGQFKVPGRDNNTAGPELTIYPTNDTLPENVLKLYLEFTRPMQEGRALNYIRIVKNNKDTLPGVFLDLQPELWNKENTILTVWFDPGRIKRDLQPNKTMGAPIQKGNKYQLVILSGWPDQDGKATAFTYLREFIAGPRDSTMPDPSQWKIEIPKPESDQPVEVIFNEPLDYVLIKNAIRILDGGGKPVPGTINVNDEEKGFNYVPSSPWKAGNYILEVESRLEDNAGNNLNHPFDNDLTQKQAQQKESVKRAFQIK